VPFEDKAPAVFIPADCRRRDWLISASATKPKTKIRRRKTTQKYRLNFPYAHNFHCNVTKNKVFYAPGQILFAGSLFQGLSINAYPLRGRK
jgi:hypothetical protein